MALFAELRKAARPEEPKRPTFFVTWEETTVQGAYIEADNAEAAIEIARTGVDGDELIDVSGKYIEYVEATAYNAEET